MADGFKSAVSEAVIKPVVDEVGKALETGVQSIKGNYQQQSTIQNIPNPALAQQNKVQEQSGMTEARRKIKYWQDLGAHQKQVRDVNKQKQEQSMQQDEKKKQIKQYEIVAKKKENMAVAQKQRSTETKKGVGG